MTSKATTLTITRPDDWHIHLRDGVQLKDTVRDVSRYMGRAIIMPNLVPPATCTDTALSYRDRIMAAEPQGNFEPLMVLYLTDKTTPEEIRKAKSKTTIYKKIKTIGPPRTRLDFLAGASSFKFGTSMGKYIKDTKSFMLGLNYQTNEDLNKKEKLFSTEFEWFSYTSYMKSKKVKSNKEHTSTLYLLTFGPQYRISFFNNHLNFFLSLGVGLCNWSSSIFDLNTKKDKSNQELSAAFPHGGGLDINLFGPLSLGARVMNNYLSLHSDNQYLEAHAFISWSQTLDP